MKKKYLLLIAMLLSFACCLQAQDVIDPEEEEEEEEVEVEVTDDEVTVTDMDGNEEVIDLPEAMTFDLDSLMNLYMSKTYLSIAGDCQTANEGPAYTKEELLERLKRLPTIVEMPYNEVVHKFIDRYAGRLRHSATTLKTPVCIVPSWVMVLPPCLPRSLELLPIPLMGRTLVC